MTDIERLWSIAEIPGRAEDRQVVRDAADELERLRAALQPFAEVVRWAERNGHDLEKDFDMILRGPGHQFAGHLQAQARHFIEAAKALTEHEG